jgi:hypothetical protein
MSMSHIPHYLAKTSDWALEVLMVLLLGLHPPQPLRETQKSSSAPPPPITTTASSGQATPAPNNASFETPSSPQHTIEMAKSVLLPRLHQTIMAMLHLQSHSDPDTVQSDFYDTLISCALSPMLCTFDILATLPTQPIKLPPTIAPAPAPPP